MKRREMLAKRIFIHLTQKIGLPQMRLLYEEQTTFWNELGLIIIKAVIYCRNEN